MRTGALHRLSQAELGFAYRHSGVPEDWIFVGGAFDGRADDPKAIHAPHRRTIQTQARGEPADPRPHRRHHLHQSDRATRPGS